MGGWCDKEAVNYAELSWPQADDLLRGDRPTVLLLPVGSTEPHGPHSPLCTDLVISLGMCRRAVERLRDDPELRLAVLPPIPYAVTRYAGSFGGCIHIAEDTLHALLVDVAQSLIVKGHRWIVLVNNHFEPEHVGALYRAIRTVKEETGVLVGYLDLTRKERAQYLGEEFRRGECHAGRYETALVLAERPELVNTEVQMTLPYVPVNLVEVIGRGIKDFKDMGLEQAYCGEPAKATPEEGEAVYEVLTDMLIGQIRAVIAGTAGCEAPGFYQRVGVGAEAGLRAPGLPRAQEAESST